MWFHCRPLALEMKRERMLLRSAYFRVRVLGVRRGNLPKGKGCYCRSAYLHFRFLSASARPASAPRPRAPASAYFRVRFLSASARPASAPRPRASGPQGNLKIGIGQAAAQLRAWLLA